MDLQSQLQAALGNAYTFERELSGGGMSRVFVAQESRLGRKVVVKVLDRSVTGAINIERFTREVQLAARLQHPHIVPILTAGEADDALYYTMPLVAGETLRHRLERDRKIPTADALRIASEVADALSYAHREGVVHRDVKPENIMLSGGHALVVDFGIAKALDASKTDQDESLTGVGMRVGTPAYMSPEQAAGEGVIDGRSDVYSLAVVLYEMLSGHQPFTGSSAAVIIAKRFSEVPTPLRAMDAGIPVSVERAIERAMSQAPDHRFSTPIEFAAALHADRESRSSEKSIAVLPFTNMSSDADSEYFSDGITEEIINALAQLPGLRVSARTSSFAFKGRNADVAEISAKLRVTTVLEGSVRRSGNRLRITAQLINGADGYHLWSERYDRDMADVFAIQDDIARAIADALKVTLLAGADIPLVRKPTEHVDAYRLYLKGRYHWSRRTEAEVLVGLEHFQRALETDPNYALALIGVADSYNILGFYGWLAPRDSFPRALEAVSRALAIDPTLPAAYNSRAYVRCYYDWAFADAESDWLHAIALDPASSSAKQFYGNMLCAAGRFDEGIAIMNQAIEAEPLSLICNAALAWSLYFARRYEESIAQFRSTIELDPNFMVAHLWLGKTYLQTGALEAAMREFEIAIRQSERTAIALAALAAAHARTGRGDQVHDLLGELKRLGERRYVPNYDVAAIYAALGEADAALDHLDRAYDERGRALVLLRVDPEFATLRAHPRFEDLARRVGVAPRSLS